jgi:hypothetical protein
MDGLVAAFMGVMGTAIAVVWGLDIVRGRGIDRSRGLRAARDPDSGVLLLPHWLAEYGTAAGLLAGAVAIALGWALADAIAFASLGALAYTSVNSLGWALARPERRAYAVAMAVGAVGGGVCLVLLALR